MYPWPSELVRNTACGLGNCIAHCLGSPYLHLNEEPSVLCISIPTLISAPVFSELNIHHRATSAALVLHTNNFPSGKPSTQHEGQVISVLHTSREGLT